MLSGTNTYSGDTTINPGTLPVAADANLCTAVGLAFGGGKLLHEQPCRDPEQRQPHVRRHGNNAPLSGSIGGTGLTKIGTGPTLSVRSTYLRPTAVNAGTLQAKPMNVFAPNKRVHDRLRRPWR